MLASRRASANRCLSILALAFLATACVSNAQSASLEGTEEMTPPGTPPYPAELRARLADAFRARGADYEPRTHHLREDGSPRYINRLIFEASPYLLQHAHNPVNWYPWGEEAFAKARREEKPIFLSIGYSTCHWCHVMERESFENVEIATLLNENFVSIKIDREQRPDIDEIYMTAVHLMRQRGGWPMSSFLTPEGEPFFGATYFPPQPFTQLLHRVEELWQNERAELVSSAGRIAAAVEEVTAARGEAAKLGDEILDRALTSLLQRHDKALGGFSGAPKFPHEPELLFLLDQALRRAPAKAHAETRAEALAALERTLDAMARGGIYDQVGGGFHRYSTDARWQVPHFEKMLYNQAHLSRAYLEAYRLTGEPFYARVARQTLDYVLREMTAPAGGFYSATDADSEGEEGLFFVWRPGELRAALSPEDATLAIDLFGVRDEGNFEGRNILHLPLGLGEYAEKKGLALPALLERVDRIRETLWQEREKRPHPIRDDKILTSWNGMMITSFAAGSEILGEARYLKAALKAADFLWRENHRGEGRLWRVYLGGSSSIPASQNDYAYFTEALLALYDQTGEEGWLKRARQIADGMLEQFWDAEAGGFFMSAENVDPLLIARPKSPNDGAIPSGNSVAVRALLRLSARGDNTVYRDRAEASLAAFAALLDERPSAYAYMLVAVAELRHGEAGPRQYAAAGTVRAFGRLETEGDALRVRVSVRLREGWHINAHEPLQPELIPTVLAVEDAGWQLGEVRYPEGERVELGFQEEPLLVYQGEVEMLSAVRRLDTASRLLPVKLRIQACNDEICLRPEEIVLEITPDAAS